LFGRLRVIVGEGDAALAHSGLVGHRLLMGRGALLHSIHNVEVLMGLASGVLCSMEDRLFLFGPHWLRVLSSAIYSRGVATGSCALSPVTTLVLLHHLLLKFKHVATLGRLRHGRSRSHWLLVFRTFGTRLLRIGGELLDQMPDTSI
jgi:hypothetical protein